MRQLPWWAEVIITILTFLAGFCAGVSSRSVWATCSYPVSRPTTMTAGGAFRRLSASGPRLSHLLDSDSKTGDARSAECWHQHEA